MLLQAVTTSRLIIAEKIYAGYLGGYGNPVSVGYVADSKSGLIHKQSGTGCVVPGVRPPDKSLKTDPLPGDSLGGTYGVEIIRAKAGLASRIVTKRIGARGQGSGMIPAIPLGIVLYHRSVKILVGGDVTNVATTVDSSAKG